MNNDLAVRITGSLSAPPKSSDITISGNNNNFVAHANTVENHLTILLSDPRSRREEKKEKITLDSVRAWQLT